MTSRVSPTSTVSTLTSRSLHRWPVLVLTGSILACGSDRPDDRSVTVEFPTVRAQQALHCTAVLAFRTQQIASVAGEGRFGDWVSEDFVEAHQAALSEVDPSVGARSHEEVAAMVRRITDAFDSNSDGRIDGRAELEEFSRHVGLCMGQFATGS